MPPHLHPRSTLTTTLFTGTLLASFAVVALPHVLPCPVPRKRYADKIELAEMMEDGGCSESQQDEKSPRKRRRHPERECPIPKPSGLIAELMGITNKKMSISGNSALQGLSEQRLGPTPVAEDDDGLRGRKIVVAKSPIDQTAETCK